MEKYSADYFSKIKKTDNFKMHWRLRTDIDSTSKNVEHFLPGCVVCKNAELWFQVQL